MFKMKKQDLLELYQLCGLYNQVYHDKISDELREKIAIHYKEDTGEDIKNASNPRNAGRKKKYSDEVNKMIFMLNQDGLSKRSIAKEIGCSLGHVQDVLKEKKSK